MRRPQSRDLHLVPAEGSEKRMAAPRPAATKVGLRPRDNLYKIDHLQHTASLQNPYRPVFRPQMLCWCCNSPWQQCNSRGNWRRYRRFHLKANHGGKGMLHVIWYVIIGLISGLIAKSVMHEHMTLFWTIVLGIVGSILGGGLTHILFRSKNERYHPAGLIFSTLGAILVLFICYKLKIHLP
jgi:uncharacterized membrane protein YeaQ/YmgE (transglycosylase-associated protein family)